MSAESQEPYKESNLESPEYRQRLKRKLDCLIAVLEVATAKVRRSLAGPDPDVERLQKIQKNLTDTLQVCKRAKVALDRRGALPSDLPIQLDKVVEKSGLNLPLGTPVERTKSPQGMVVEMSSAEEFERFKDMEPIRNDEVAEVDFDDLCRKLQS